MKRHKDIISERVSKASRMQGPQLIQKRLTRFFFPSGGRA